MPLKKEVGTQFSAITEERPDEKIYVNVKSELNFQNELRKFLQKEGPYKYCKMIEEISSKDQDYCEKVYKYKPEDLYEIGNNIFKEYTFQGNSIKDFLHNVSAKPNYGLAFHS